MKDHHHDGSFIISHFCHDKISALIKCAYLDKSRLDVTEPAFIIEATSCYTLLCEMTHYISFNFKNRKRVKYYAKIGL